MMLATSALTSQSILQPLVILIAGAVWITLPTIMIQALPMTMDLVLTQDVWMLVRVITMHWLLQMTQVVNMHLAPVA
jgi:hypothetical protein